MTLIHRSRPCAVGMVLAAVTALAPVAAGSQGLPEGGHGVVTMTRGMRVFSDAEAKIIGALKAHDLAMLDRLVTADFEQRSQAAPGQPLPREDWIKQAPADAAKSAGFRQVAVHDLGDTAIVSFQWLHPAPDFVVDVWRKQPGGGDWQLAIRYLGAAAPDLHEPAAASAAARPASAAASTASTSSAARS